MKVKLFTHDDLDGVGCRMIMEAAFGKQGIKVDTEHHNYDSLHKSLLEFVMLDNEGNRESDKYEKIFITDISPKDDLVIKAIDQNIADKLTLIDHHKTAEFLNEYSWAKVTPMVASTIKCATDLVYESFKVESPIVNLLSLEFVKLVHDLDTWEWEKSGNIKAVQLANLLDIYDTDYFIEKFQPQLVAGGEITFDYIDQKMLDIQDARKQRYIERQKQNIVKREINGNSVGVIFGSAYQSETGNILAKENPDVDYIAMLNFNGVSFRGIKDDIDLGQIAKQYGGGGHPKASGCSVTDEKKDKIIDIIMGL